MEQFKQTHKESEEIKESGLSANEIKKVLISVIVWYIYILMIIES